MFCSNCGTQISGSFCPNCGAAKGTEPTGGYAAPQHPTAAPSASSKSRVTAGVLGILLGGLGIHKFYMGKIGAGVVYILLCWTYIPAIVGLVEGIIYLTQDETTFQRNISNGKFF